MKQPLSAMPSYPEMLERFEADARSLAAAQPELMSTFWGLHKTAFKTDALDTKTKELIALAISVAMRCDGCISHHVPDALAAGATREEIADTLGVAALMCGGVGVVYATHAMQAVDQFAARQGEVT